MAQRMRWGTFRGSGPELYQRHMVGAIFRPWAGDLLALADPRANARVLDVACGTGAMTRLVAERVGGAGRVVGLDLSPGMLAVARSSPDARIAWLVGSATALPFPDGAFDLVVCHQGLQFVPDRPAGLREMRRTLVPRGRLMLGVFCSSPGHAALADALVPLLGPGAAEMLGEPFALADRDELHSLVLSAGFEQVVIRRTARTARFASPDDFIGYLLASRLAGAAARLSEVGRAALVEKARAALGAYVDAEGLALPMESHLVVACSTTS